MSERRIFRMLSPFLSELPPYLTTDSGTNNGYMIGQYTAAALGPRARSCCHRRVSTDRAGDQGGPRQHGDGRGAQW